MKHRPIKNFVRRFVPGPFVFMRGLKLIFSKRSYLRQQGYWLSALHKIPLTIDGDPLPWMNYGVIDFLVERLGPEMIMFEYGSGYSTEFYANRVEKVFSVEHNYQWFELLSKKLPGNVRLRFAALADDGHYVNAAVETGEKFDFIVVDGRSRVACIKSALAALKEHGVMLLDDSERERYREGVQFLLENGFVRLNFRGLKPGSIETYTTSIFYRRENCFRI